MMNFTTSEWLKQDFDLGGRSWRINKLPPIIAKEVLMEHVRPCFSALDGIDIKAETSIAVIFGRIPYTHLKALSTIFSEMCIKTRNSAGQWVPLRSNVDEFTQGMDPMDLISLDMRCLAVNFGESVSAFVKNMTALAGADISQVQGALTPSSSGQ